MSSAPRIAIGVLVCVLSLGALGLALLVQGGFSARDRPSAAETYIARRLRRLAIPAGARDAVNPVRATPEVLGQAREHFADHCATCHANDGSGDTAIGRNLYPPAPDMRAEPTQSLTDGELFFIIHNGIRFTGMPAWGDADPAKDRDSWKLVHFIRRLPHLTAEEIDEMKKLNPKSRHELEEEEEVEKFLHGEDGGAAADEHRDQVDRHQEQSTNSREQSMQNREQSVNTKEQSMNTKTALLTAMLALACGAPVLAHGGQTHIMGTVTAVEADRVVVRDREGQTVSVRVTKDTRYEKDGARASAATLAAGDRVVVEAAEREGTLTATEIRSSSRRAKGEEEKSRHEHH